MQRTITRRTERAHVLNTDEIRATLKHLGIWPDMRNNERLTITAMDFDGKECSLTVRTTLVEVSITAEQPMPPAPVAMTSEELRRRILHETAHELDALAYCTPGMRPKEPWQIFDKRLQPGPSADAHPKDWSIFTDKNGTCATGLEFYARGSEQSIRDLWKERDKRKGQWVLYDGERQPVAELFNGEDQLAKRANREKLRAELQKAAPADLPAMGVPGLPPWPPKSFLPPSRHDLMNEMPKPAVPIITGEQVEAMTDPKAAPAEAVEEKWEGVAIATAHLPPCEDGYRWLTEGELTDPAKGDEFNQGGGLWTATQRTGRLVHAGLVGAYRRPMLVPHSAACISGARDHNCPGCQPTTCTCTGDVADPECPEHRDL